MNEKIPKEVLALADKQTKRMQKSGHLPWWWMPKVPATGQPRVATATSKLKQGTKVWVLEQVDKKTYVEGHGIVWAFDVVAITESGNQMLLHSNETEPFASVVKEAKSKKK